MKQIHTAVIIGLKWFDRPNGNTYHISRIYINGRDDMNRNDLREWLNHNAIIEETHVTKAELRKAGCKA